MKKYSDEKGKVFTDIISKQAIPVIIQTIQQTIRGEVYVLPEDRLIDHLKQPEQFLAVTNAVLCSHDGDELYRANFFSINKDHIVWVMPRQEILESPDNIKEA